MNPVIVSGAFDDLVLADFRFLDEASKRGPLHVQLLSDRAIAGQTGKPPKFPQVERRYFMQALKCVESIELAEHPSGANFDREMIDNATLKRLPSAPATPDNPQSSRKKVVVTGCYDWFHSGHVRFFEECSELGDLYVIVGHDANIELLKGKGHPLFPDVQRRYIVGMVRYVKLALISTGNGWMDAEPEIVRLRADIYAVNEDGDKPEKRAFCEKHGLEYRVLKRLPKEGLPRRQSTDFRGF
jgi:cytidyltransferase-like protein